VENNDMKVKLAAVAVLAAVGVGATVFAFGGIGANAASTTRYLTATATRGDVSDSVAATGNLASDATYGLVFGDDPYAIVDTNTTAPASTTTWPVRTVKVKVGDSVKAGDVLATADPASARATEVAARNALRSANIALAAAKTQLTDAETAGVTATIRQARMGLYNATNQYASAAHDLADAEATLSRATLASPIAGVVTAVNIAAGADAPAGAAITVASTTYAITTDVVESDLANVKLTQKATVTISALSTDVSGTVTAISPVASTSSSGVVSYPVTISLTGAPADARAGMSADVTITTASATGVITIPSSALLGTKDNYRVLTLGADGTASPTAVQVGLLTSSLAEITSGLSEGATVVTGTASDLVSTTTTGGGFGGIGVPVGGGRLDGGGRNGNGGNNQRTVTGP